LYSKSKIKEKEKKRNINNNLAVLPSHDRQEAFDKLKGVFTTKPVLAVLHC